ncbi:hypothetical protein [Streptococcus marmotae]|uniref:hypothetical protein n=1 Tax=Streptococcus marmotae TaxID=1825069 RepID=UPI0012FDE50B|nr:hypothetical protein [Streptococcus marmotae]
MKLGKSSRIVVNFDSEETYTHALTDAEKEAGTLGLQHLTLSIKRQGQIPVQVLTI